MNTEAATVVAALLAAAGLSPTPEEAARLAAAYPGWQAELAALYDMPDARYETPALVFRPEP
ncbi:hypothetical protein [Actinomadura violacea]|uniref:Uncharacterized protein n=1 Tax=Actinomadura violacea TaxID=2819934 RepID=A0ABS3RLF4_9ACTN|nr:hypothetical protein [Actinomadura violacea]MBO2457545.1 hypothetical protein [Actinomadura violacea]